MKQSRLSARVFLLLCIIWTACGSPGRKTPGTADTVTGAEESSASDTSRKDGTTEKQHGRQAPLNLPGDRRK